MSAIVHAGATNHVTPRRVTMLVKRWVLEWGGLCNKRLFWFSDLPRPGNTVDPQNS